MPTTKPVSIKKPDAGFRLGDMRSVIDGLVNHNGCSSTYAITATGSTAATAAALSSVYNQIDTSTSGTGVNLPLSTGRRTTPYQFCAILNNSTFAVKVYGRSGSVDTINGIAGATGITQAANSAVLYVSAKGGNWFAVGSANLTPSGQTGTFTATGATELVVPNVNIGPNSVVTFGLKTAAGTIAGAPFMSSVVAGTSFGVKAGASDTSVYNYTIIG